MLVDNDALTLLDVLIKAVQDEGPWNIAEAPDGHSKAWHAMFILRHAREYLERQPIPQTHWYMPIFTREKEPTYLR